MDLTKEDDAYIYGLLLADGHLYETTRNRGKLSIELRIRDIDILRMIEYFFSDYSSTIKTRKRDTNFAKRYESCSITFHSYELREIIKSFGFPSGRKCEIADVPNCDYNKSSFWRGYLDGNGSYCFNKSNIPLVSFGTKSEFLKNSYLEFLYDVTFETKNVNRNKRDNFYNIVSSRERAQLLVSSLGYETATLFIQHKKNDALKLLEWVRI